MLQTASVLILPAWKGVLPLKPCFQLHRSHAKTGEKCQSAKSARASLPELGMKAHNLSSRAGCEGR